MEDVIRIDENGHITDKLNKDAARYYSERFLRRLCKKHNVPLSELNPVTKLQLRKIKSIVAKVYGINVSDFVISARDMAYTDARRALVHYLYQHGWTSAMLAVIVKRDRSTITYTLNRHRDLVETDKVYRERYNRIEEMFNNAQYYGKEKRGDN